MIESMGAQLRDVKAAERLAVIELRLDDFKQAIEELKKEIAALRALQTPVSHTGEHKVIDLQQQQDVIAIGWLWKQRATILSLITFVLALLGVGGHVKGCSNLVAAPSMTTTASEVDAGLNAAHAH
jgi:hypothetical protein